MDKTVNGVKIEVVSGDIASQGGVDCVVNAANAQLQTGGGVAGAIHRAAGPGLAEEARPFAPIRPGEAVITSGQKLPNDYVIHCLGPVYGKDQPSEGLLVDCYRNALKLADEKGIRSIAFPSISTGAFGYPMEEAARVALDTVVETTAALESVGRIRFVLFGEEALHQHESALAEAVK